MASVDFWQQQNAISDDVNDNDDDIDDKFSIDDTKHVDLSWHFNV